MYIQKRIVRNYVLTTLFISTLFLSPLTFAQAESQKSFTDVKDYMYERNINNLGSIVTGYSDGTFRPAQLITRAEFIAIALKFQFNNQIKITQEGNCYPDVREEWFSQYICSATEAGLLRGYPDGRFRPERPIIFAEASAIISKVRNLSNNKLEPDSKPWYYPFIKALEVNNRIPPTITGFNHSLTRGEAAYIFAPYSYSSTLPKISYEDVEKLQVIKNKKNANKELASNLFKRIFGYPLSLSDIPDDVDIAAFKKIIWGTSAPDGEGKYKLLDSELYKYKYFIYCYNPANERLSLIEGADAPSFQTFENINNGFAADKNFIYNIKQRGECYSPVIALKGKEYVYENIYKGSSNVYYFDFDYLDKENGGQFVELNGADGSSFKEFSEKITVVGGKLFEDKDNIYFWDDFSRELTKLDVDKGSLKFIDTGVSTSSMDWFVFKDKNGVYYARGDSLNKMHVFEDADLVTFKLLSIYSLRAIDKNALYAVDGIDRFHKITGVDVNTFNNIPTQGDEKLKDLPLYFKDKNRVYDGEDFAVLDWADPNTFKVFAVEYGYSMDGAYFVYGQNRDSFWYFDKRNNKEIIVPEIDSESFKILSEAESRRDFGSGYVPEKFHYIDQELCTKFEAEFNENPTKTIDEKTKETFKKDTDGTCYIIIERWQDENIIYSNILIASDGSSVWKYDSYGGQLVKVESVNGASFKKISNLTTLAFFKDANAVYIGGDLKKIPGIDPNTADLRFYKGNLYIFDQNHIYKVGKDGVELIPNADPERFFIRRFEEEKFSSSVKGMAVTELDFEKENGVFLLDLDSGEIIKDLETEEEIFSLASEGFDLFVDPSDPEISSLSGTVSIKEESFEKIVSDDKISSGKESWRIYGESLKEDTVFVIRSDKGTLFKVQAFDIYPNVVEIGLMYEPIN